MCVLHRAFPFWLALSMTVLSPEDGWTAGPLLRYREPLNGAVTLGFLVTAVRGEAGAEARLGPIAGSTPRHSVFCAICNSLPLRFHVAHRGFWIGEVFSLAPGSIFQTSEGLLRYELGDLLKGKALGGPNPEEAGHAID